MDRVTMDTMSTEPIHRIVLRNEFHGSERSLRCRNGQVLSESTIRRIRQDLCHIKECRCAWNAAGTRGQQHVWIDGQRHTIELLPVMVDGQERLQVSIYPE